MGTANIRTEAPLRLSNSPLDRALFRVEHWLLSPGRHDAAQLRGYLRVRAWRNCTSMRDRLHLLKVAAKLPLRAFRDSRAAVRTYGEPVERDHGKGRARQLAELWYIWVRHGVHPDSYYRYRLFRPGHLSRAGAFFEEQEFIALHHLVNAYLAPDAGALMGNKAQFEQWLRDHEIPTLKTLMEFSHGGVVNSALPDGALPKRDLFSKPCRWAYGYGATRWEFDGEGWVGPDGRRRSETELLAELTAEAGERGLLLQERMRNHRALTVLTPAALSTVRIITVRGGSGTLQIVLAVAKIPTGSAATDHMRLGGFAAPVDLATGRLGRPVRKDERTVVAFGDRHPDTGVQIEGFQLPCWEEAKRLALRAHELLGEVTTVGWDVAITDDGPIIVEANNPGPTSAQMPTNQPLGETAVARAILDRLRLALAGAQRTGSA
jgi:hypothetical protein